MSSAKNSTINQRLVFENALALLQQNNYDLQKAKLTQSELRLEALMSTSVSQYQFPVVVTDGGDNTSGARFVTEVRLRQADVFIVSSMNLQCAKPSGVADGSFPTLNYGNPNVFTTSGVPAAVRGAYDNGTIGLLIDNDVVLYKWPAHQHYNAPITQQNSWVQYTGATPVPVQDSIDGGYDGSIAVEPNIILAGNSSLQLTFALPSAMAAVETTGRWILRLGGVLAQNCSKTANTRE